MATPPMHIYHSLLLHEVLTAVHSSYGYGLLSVLIMTQPFCKLAASSSSRPVVFALCSFSFVIGYPNHATI